MIEREQGVQVTFEVGDFDGLTRTESSRIRNKTTKAFIAKKQKECERDECPLRVSCVAGEAVVVCVIPASEGTEEHAEIGSCALKGVDDLEIQQQFIEISESLKANPLNYKYS